MDNEYDDADHYNDYGDDPYNDYGDDPDSYKGEWSDDEWKQDLGGVDIQSEFKDRERAGGTIGCWLTGIDGRPLKTQDPRGRFCLKVDAICRNISSNCTSMGMSISEDEIQFLLNKSQNLNRIQFLNPTAFVLGYLATNGGKKKITKTSLNNVFTCYIDIVANDNSIKKPDIIRYARLWKLII